MAFLRAFLPLAEAGRMTRPLGATIVLDESSCISRECFSVKILNGYFYFSSVTKKNKSMETYQAAGLFVVGGVVGGVVVFLWFCKQIGDWLPMD